MEDRNLTRTLSILSKQLAILTKIEEKRVLADRV
jgi:hypothetical protein